MNRIKEAFPEFEKPAVAVDTVIIRVKDCVEGSNRQVPIKQMQVLLVKKPEEKEWHLPGTILRLGETPRDSIKRIIDNKVSIGDIAFEQLYTVADDPMRDERGHIISLVYIGMCNNTQAEESEESSEFEKQWFWISKPHENDNNARTFTGETDDSKFMYLKYDHHKIVSDTISRLKGKLMYTSIGFNFVSKLFTIKELENTFNAINERAIPGFRRLIINKVVGTGKISDGKAFRPAELFMKKE